MKRFFTAIRELTAPPGNHDPSFLCRRTQTLSIWEGSLWALMWGLGESYISPFALLLNAGNLTMAFVGTGPVLITALAQLTGAALLDRLGHRLPLILTGMTVQAVAYLPLFFLPALLPSSGGIAALIIAVTICFFFLGLSVPAWMSLMGDVVDPTDRGRYFSNRSRLIMYTMLGAMLLAGIIVNQWEKADYAIAGFGFLFVIACLARLTSVFFMRRHYDAPLQRSESNSYFSLFDFIRATPRSNFARFTFTIALMNGATQIASPFFAVYMLRDLQWTYLQFTVNMVAFLISQTLFVRWWGALSDRHGNRAVLVATCCLLPILPLFWVFSTNYLVLLLAQVISGASWSGFNLAASNFIYDSVTQQKRARAFSYYNLINGLFSVGGLVAEHAPQNIRLGPLHISLISSLPIVFIVSSIARALAAWIMLPRFSEVRVAEPISPLRILWRLGVGQPLFVQAREFVPGLRNAIRTRTKKL